MTTTNQSTVPNPQAILQLASGYWASATLLAANELGVFGALAQGELAAGQVATSLGTNPHATEMLLDGCVALGLLTKAGPLYANTPESAAFLVPGAPADLSKALRYNADVYPAWGRLADLVRTGEPAERAAVHLGEDRERTRRFVLSMHSRALGIGRAAVPELDLQDCRKLLDVGGGPGTYSVLIAKAHPQLDCTVLDLPGVAAVADELIGAAGMQGRVRTLAGDYHVTPFPEGNDAVLFFGVLHQESPAVIAELMRRAYASLVPGGRVYVLDMMTDESHARPVFSALFALNMALTTPHGWVFSDQELAGWLAASGFTGFSCRPLPPPMPHWLAVARKA